jgi:hypothetical protein
MLETKTAWIVALFFMVLSLCYTNHKKNVLINSLQGRLDDLDELITDRIKSRGLEWCTSNLVYESDRVIGIYVDGLHSLGSAEPTSDGDSGG